MWADAGKDSFSLGLGSLAKRTVSQLSASAFTKLDSIYSNLVIKY